MKPRGPMPVHAHAAARPALTKYDLCTCSWSAILQLHHQAVSQPPGMANAHMRPQACVPGASLPRSMAAVHTLCGTMLLSIVPMALAHASSPHQFSATTPCWPSVRHAVHVLRVQDSLVYTLHQCLTRMSHIGQQCRLTRPMLSHLRPLQCCQPLS